jgi:hypothetical protein
LGHLVGKDGIRVDPKNIEAMQDWPHPKNLKRLRGFLGLTGYYRKFVNNYGNIATPLMALLKNNSFSWTPAISQDFQTLKTAMCTTPILALRDFTRPLCWNVMPRGKESVLSLCKKVNLWPSPAGNYLKGIWANPYMKRKCWLFCMSLISGTLISWGNVSKLRQTIKASSTFWNNAFPPQRNKNG